MPRHLQRNIVPLQWRKKAAHRKEVTKARPLEGAQYHVVNQSVEGSCPRRFACSTVVPRNEVNRHDDDELCDDYSHAAPKKAPDKSIAHNRPATALINGSVFMPF